MTPLDSIRVALDSFQANPLRSALTALGIIIGVAAVIAMAAVGAGAEERVARAIHSIGSDILIIHNGTGVSGSRRTGQGSLMTLTEEDVLALQLNLPSVLVAAGSVAGTDQVVYGNKNWSTTLRGVTPEYFVARNWTVVEGRNMMRSDERSAAKVALLGQSVVGANGCLHLRPFSLRLPELLVDGLELLLEVDLFPSRVHLPLNLFVQLLLDPQDLELPHENLPQDLQVSVQRSGLQ